MYYDDDNNQTINGQRTMNQSFNSFYETIKAALLGLATGDALGVPSEFADRQSLVYHPVSSMMGYGTHNQPPGTWSDDSSLTFCLAESIADGYDLQRTAEYFVKWFQKAFWTPHRNVFDVRYVTQTAIKRLMIGESPYNSGETGESSNGNGSLMRTLPLVFYLIDKPVTVRFEIVRQVSAITHAHIRSAIACFYYVEYARLILLNIDKFEAYRILNDKIGEYFGILDIPSSELTVFKKVFGGNLEQLQSHEIVSDSNVLHTLETTLWCFLTTENYRTAVLKAVNLGSDTDTNGALTGGLAGIYYGLESIPEKWLNVLARRTDIEYLAYRMAEKLT